jgi:hypothetical protein
VRDVIAVPDIGQRNVPQIAEPLLQHRIVGEGLTRMLQVAERVDHRNRCVHRHIFDGRMREGTQHDDIDPARNVVRDVVQALTRIDAAACLIHEECVAAQARHAGFKGEPSAQ